MLATERGSMGPMRIILSLLRLAVCGTSTCNDIKQRLTPISHDVAPRSQFERTFDRVYKISGSGTSSPISPQEIALVFIVMAQGTMFNIEMPNFDSSAEDWLHLAERALVKGDFLSNNTLAGVQTLVRPYLHLLPWGLDTNRPSI